MSDDITILTGDEPIVVIARQIVFHFSRMEEAERVGQGAEKHSIRDIYSENSSRQHGHAESDLRNALSCFEAESLLAAMAQLGEAHAIFTSVANLSKDADDIRRFDRLLYSALRLLRRYVDESDVADLDRILSWNIDPWEKAADRVKVVEESTPAKTAARSG